MGRFKCIVVGGGGCEMSRVTDLILTEFDSVGGDSDMPEPMVKINDYLGKHNSAFKKCDEHAGGGKFMQVGVWLAAANYLGDVAELVEVVIHQRWTDPEYVQLFVKEEEDNKFQMVLDGIDPIPVTGRLEGK